MYFSQDMKDLVDLFHQHELVYMLVGGYAVNYYGYMRMTQDIDFVVYPSSENAAIMMRVLSDFGFAGAQIPKEKFEVEGTAIHLGVEPNRIDILTNLFRMDNKAMFENTQQGQFGDMTISIISRTDLIAAKQKSPRLKDQADAEELAKI